MNVLVYGAGVIGSIYAARLQETGYNVTLLARGKRAASPISEPEDLEEFLYSPIHIPTPRSNLCNVLDVRDLKMCRSVLKLHFQWHNCINQRS